MKKSSPREKKDQLPDLNPLKEKIAQLEQKIYLIEVSISWRLTKPLRWISKRFPSLSTLFRSIFRPIIFIKRKHFTLTKDSKKNSTISLGPERPIFRDSLIKIKTINHAEGNSFAVFERGPVLVLSHFLPTSPRAGNEYRLQQVLNWFKKNHVPYILIHSPLIGEEPISQLLQKTATEHPNFISINRNGELNFSSNIRDLRILLNSLDGQRIRLPKDFDKEQISYPNPELYRVVKEFSNDAITWLILKIIGSIQPSAIYANYIFMSRTFDWIDPKIVKIIDTHDVFSSKDEKVRQYGIDTYTMSPYDEAFLAKKSDVIIAIQKEERALLKAMLPQKDVITLGVEVTLDPIKFSNKVNENVVLFVASSNPMNIKGLFDFFAFAWPIVKREIPSAEFWVVGAVGESLIKIPDGVKVLGKVDDLRDYYTASKVVINPAIAGTGLKIKTIEALGYGRPVVCWDAGIDGVPIALRSYCKCVNSWFEFSKELIDLLKKSHDELNDWINYSEIEISLDPKAIYGEFQHLLKEKKILNVD